jgi:hypothetical protein
LWETMHPFADFDADVFVVHKFCEIALWHDCIWNHTCRDAHVGAVLGFHGGFEAEVFQVDRDKFGFRCGDDAV